MIRRLDLGILEALDSAATGLPKNTITRQERNGGIVTLVYASGAGYPPSVNPPSLQNVRFSLSAPTSVIEGERFTLTLQRDRYDGQPHILNLAYRPDGLLEAPPSSFTFAGKSNTATVELTAKPGTPGDGDKPVVIVLTGTDADAAVGKPSGQRVTITDRRVAQSYVVTSDNEMTGKEPFSFVISRSDLADQVDPTYDIVEDNKTIARGPLSFGVGENSTWVAVPTQDVDPCGIMLRFTLHWRGEPVQRSARLGSDLRKSANCGADGPVASSDDPSSEPAGITDTPSPTETACTGAGCQPCLKNCDPAKLPWWPFVLGMIGIAAVGYGLHKWPWWPRPKARCSLAAATIVPVTLGEGALRWPGASAQSRIEPGEMHLPDPLPVETDDD